MYMNVCHFIANRLLLFCIQEKMIKETMFSKKIEFKFKSKIQKISLNTDKIL